MKIAFRIFIVLIVMAIIAAAIAGVYWLMTFGKTHEWAPVTSPIDAASSSPITDASSTGAFVPSPVDTSSWQSYRNDELGYSISYPANLIIQNGAPTVSFAFPKDAYFHWPLLDDAKVSLTVATTCPAVEGDRAGHPSQASTTMSGYDFLYSEGGGAAAGNIYREYAYDTLANGVCYHIDLLDHGANGAGLYVDDQTLIKQYDAQHAIDLASIRSVFMAMAQSFRIDVLTQ